MNQSAPQTLLFACRDFFGVGVNDDGTTKTGMEFGKEYKMLTPKDKEDIKMGLEQNGYVILPTAGVAA